MISAIYGRSRGPAGLKAHRVGTTAALLAPVVARRPFMARAFFVPRPFKAEMATRAIFLRLRLPTEARQIENLSNSQYTQNLVRWSRHLDKYPSCPYSDFQHGLVVPL